LTDASCDTRHSGIDLRIIARAQVSTVLSRSHSEFGKGGQENEGCTHGERPRTLDKVRDFSIMDDGPIVDSVHTDRRVTPIEDTHEDDEPPVESLVVREEGEVSVSLG
jgi:hypothetical protein